MVDLSIQLRSSSAPVFAPRKSGATPGRPGTYTVTEETGDSMSAVYLYRLQAADVLLTRSMFLAK